MVDRSSPGALLRAFREERGLSLREAARQLHVVHPALKDWEEDDQTPTAPYRDAIEVWTNGHIKASDWPLHGRELQIVNRAALVKPVAVASTSVSRDRDSDTVVAEAADEADLAAG